MSRPHISYATATILVVAMVFRPMIWSAIAYTQAVQRTRVVMMSSFLRVIVVLSLIAAGGVLLDDALGASLGAGLGFALVRSDVDELFRLARDAIRRRR